MIEVDQSGGIAVLTLTHRKANALDIELCGEVVRRFEELSASAAQAVVLTARGGIFSAGVDLLHLADGGPAYVREFLPVLNKAFHAVFFCPKPVIAAVNGHAIAGGCVLAAAADRRLMARGAGRIGVTELLVGVPFPPMAFEIMRFVASPRFFHEIIFTGTTYTPDQGVERGLVDDIIEPEQLLGRAMSEAERLAALSPAAFALTKRQTRQLVHDELRRNGEAFDAAASEIWTAPKTVGRIRDYVARTLKK